MEPFAAGIIPYISFNGEIHFLLGLERSNGKWSGFVGGSESGETPKLTAFREFNEETSLIFENSSDFIFGNSSDFIKSQLNVVNPVLEKTPSGKIVYLWFIKFPEHLLFMNFSQFYLNQNKIKDSHFKEKSKLQWFSLSEVKNGNVYNVLKRTIKNNF